MSADFETKNFRGYKHDGYMHVNRVCDDGIWGSSETPYGDFTRADLAEVASMFGCELTDVAGEDAG